jgi:hypothetical protein
MPEDLSQNVLNDLRMQANDLASTLRDLHEALAIETAPLKKRALEEQIQEKEGELNSIEQQIERLEMQRACKAMLNMDYLDHVDSFQTVAEKQRIGAFLIHGQPLHGHYWLLRQLLTLTPQTPATPPFSFDYNSRSQRKDIDAIWAWLGANLKIPSYKTPRAEIVRCVGQKLKTQSIVLIFKNVDAVDVASIRTLIDEFWNPLANDVKVALPPYLDTRLLMFLVDYYDRVSNWDIPVAQPEDEVFKLINLICLPPLTPFSDQVLQIWLNTPISRAILPREKLRNISQTVQDILAHSENGIPEQVAEYICELHECPYEREDLWLNL